MTDRLTFASIPWPRSADELGFAESAADGLRTLNGFSLRSEGDWLALVERAPEDSLAGGLGSPGLWRVLEEGAGFARVHELPPLRTLTPDAETEPAGDSFMASLSRLVDWASATQRGECPPGWTPPPREEVESWILPSRMNLRSGPLLAKGVLVHEPRRFALAFPELVRLPAELSLARRSWLDELLLDAQRLWRLVRFGVDAPSGSVRAEIDLSGVPSEWARPLVQLALEALARAVVWVLSPLTFLVDIHAPSRALDRHSHHSLKRSTSK